MSDNNLPRNGNKMHCEEAILRFDTSRRGGDSFHEQIFLFGTNPTRSFEECNNDGSESPIRTEGGNAIHDSSNNWTNDSPARSSYVTAKEQDHISETLTSLGSSALGNSRWIGTFSMSQKANWVTKMKTSNDDEESVRVHKYRDLVSIDLREHKPEHSHLESISSHAKGEIRQQDSLSKIAAQICGESAQTIKSSQNSSENKYKSTSYSSQKKFSFYDPQQFDVTNQNKESAANFFSSLSSSPNQSHSTSQVLNGTPKKSNRLSDVNASPPGLNDEPKYHQRKDGKQTTVTINADSGTKNTNQKVIGGDTVANTGTRNPSVFSFYTPSAMESCNDEKPAHNSTRNGLIIKESHRLICTESTVAITDVNGCSSISLVDSTLSLARGSATTTLLNEKKTVESSLSMQQVEAQNDKFSKPFQSLQKYEPSPLLKNEIKKSRYVFSFYASEYGDVPVSPSHAPFAEVPTFIEIDVKEKVSMEIHVNSKAQKITEEPNQTQSLPNPENYSFDSVYSMSKQEQKVHETVTDYAEAEPPHQTLLYIDTLVEQADSNRLEQKDDVQSVNQQMIEENLDNISTSFSIYGRSQPDAKDELQNDNFTSWELQHFNAVSVGQIDSFKEHLLEYEKENVNDFSQVCEDQFKAKTQENQLEYQLQGGILGSVQATSTEPEDSSELKVTKNASKVIPTLPDQVNVVLKQINDGPVPHLVYDPCQLDGSTRIDSFMANTLASNSSDPCTSEPSIVDGNSSDEELSHGSPLSQSVVQENSAMYKETYNVLFGKSEHTFLQQVGSTSSDSANTYQILKTVGFESKSVTLLDIAHGSSLFCGGENLSKQHGSSLSSNMMESSSVSSKVIELSSVSSKVFESSSSNQNSCMNSLGYQGNLEQSPTVGENDTSKAAGQSQAGASTSLINEGTSEITQTPQRVDSEVPLSQTETPCGGNDILASLGSFDLFITPSILSSECTEGVSSFHPGHSTNETQVEQTCRQFSLGNLNHTPPRANLDKMTTLRFSPIRKPTCYEDANRTSLCDSHVYYTSPFILAASSATSEASEQCVVPLAMVSTSCDQARRIERKLSNELHSPPKVYSLTAASAEQVCLIPFSPLRCRPKRVEAFANFSSPDAHSFSPESNDTVSKKDCDSLKSEASFPSPDEVNGANNEALENNEAPAEDEASTNKRTLTDDEAFVLSFSNFESYTQVSVPAHHEIDPNDLQIFAIETHEQKETRSALKSDENEHVENANTPELTQNGILAFVRPRSLSNFELSSNGSSGYQLRSLHGRRGSEGHKFIGSQEAIGIQSPLHNHSTNRDSTPKVRTKMTKNPASPHDIIKTADLFDQHVDECSSQETDPESCITSPPRPSRVVSRDCPVTEEDYSTHNLLEAPPFELDDSSSLKSEDNLHEAILVTTKIDPITGHGQHVVSYPPKKDAKRILKNYLDHEEHFLFDPSYMRHRSRFDAASHVSEKSESSNEVNIGCVDACKPLEFVLIEKAQEFNAKLENLEQELDHQTDQFSCFDTLADYFMPDPNSEDGGFKCRRFHCGRSYRKKRLNSNPEAKLQDGKKALKTAETTNSTPGAAQNKAENQTPAPEDLTSEPSFLTVDDEEDKKSGINSVGTILENDKYQTKEERIEVLENIVRKLELRTRRTALRASRRSASEKPRADLVITKPIAIQPQSVHAQLPTNNPSSALFTKTTSKKAHRQQLADQTENKNRDELKPKKIFSFYEPSSTETDTLNTQGTTLVTKAHFKSSAVLIEALPPTTSLCLNPNKKPLTDVAIGKTIERIETSEKDEYLKSFNPKISNFSTGTRTFESVLTKDGDSYSEMSFEAYDDITVRCSLTKSGRAGMLLDESLDYDASEEESRVSLNTTIEEEEEHSDQSEYSEIKSNPTIRKHDKEQNKKRALSGINFIFDQLESLCGVSNVDMNEKYPNLTKYSRKTMEACPTICGMIDHCDLTRKSQVQSDKHVQKPVKVPRQVLEACYSSSDDSDSDIRCKPIRY